MSHVQKRKPWIPILGALAAIIVASIAAADTSAELRDWHQAFATACTSGDSQAIAALFTEDAVLIEPQRSPLRGRQAICDAVAYSRDYGLVGLGSSPDDVFADGNTAVEVGISTSSYRDGTVSRARYMILFRKEGDQWRAHRAVANVEP